MFAVGERSSVLPVPVGWAGGRLRQLRRLLHPHHAHGAFQLAGLSTWLIPEASQELEQVLLKAIGAHRSNC